MYTEIYRDLLQFSSIKSNPIESLKSLKINKMKSNDKITPWRSQLISELFVFYFVLFNFVILHFLFEQSLKFNL